MQFAKQWLVTITLGILGHGNQRYWNCRNFVVINFFLLLV